MFCVASPFDPANIGIQSTTQSGANTLDHWSQETKQLAQRILDICENDYSSLRQDKFHPSLEELRRLLISSFLEAEGEEFKPLRLFCHLFVEFLSYIDRIGSFRKSNSEPHPIAGVTGLSLAGIMAAYAIGSGDDLLERNAVLSCLTLLEMSTIAEESNLWPSNISIFLVSGLARCQVLTAIRESETKFKVVAELNKDQIVIRGTSDELDSLRYYLGVYKAKFSVADLPSLPFIWSTVDLHFTSPIFQQLVNEQFPYVMQAISGFAAQHYGLQTPFMKTDLKVPFVSCFDASFEEKKIINNDWGLVPTFGNNLLTNIFEFMMGYVVDVPLIEVSAKYLMKRQCPDKTQGILLNLFNVGAPQHISTVPESIKLESIQVPVSMNQKMLVLHQFRHPTSNVYVLTDPIKIRGSIDRARLVAAMQIQLHRDLTSSIKFKLDADEVTATTLSQEEIASIAQKAVIEHPPTSEADLPNVLEMNAKQPFDIFGGFLQSAHVIPILNTPFTIVQGMLHHLAGDGFSAFQLVPRLLQLYDTRCPDFFEQRAMKTREDDLVTVTHFNERQNLLAKSDNAKKEYWNDLLRSKFSSGLDMLKSFPNPTTPGFAGKGRLRFIEPGLWAKLGSAATQLGATRFHLLLASWAIVVSRYSNQRLINVGTAFHCRKEEWLNTVMFASNALPIPVDLGDRKSLRQFVKEVGESIGRSKKNEEYAATALIQDVLSDATLSGKVNGRSSSPLFQVEINYYRSPKIPKLEGNSIQIVDRLYPQNMQAGLTDLSAWFVDIGGKMHCNIKYKTDLYDDATVQQIESDLFRCLESVSTVEPETLVQKVQLHDEETFSKLALGPIIPKDYEAPVHTILNQAKLHGPETAIICEGDQITYTGLYNAVYHVAELLKDQPKSSVIGVFMERSVDFIVAMLGIMSAGCVYLPLNLTNPPERLKVITAEAASTFILVHERTQALAAQYFGSFQVIPIDHKSMINQQPTYTLPPIEPEQPAYTIFTSGSTGKPKGVVVPHRAFANLAHWELSAFDYPHGITCMQMFELSFDGSMMDIIGCFCSGNRMVVTKEYGNKDPQYLAEMIHKYSVYRTNMVPSHMSLLLEYLSQDPAAVAKCSSLRSAALGGEALHYSLVERVHKMLPDLQIINIYGPTETCVYSTCFDCGSGKGRVLKDLKGWATGVAAGAAEILPIGRPLYNIKALILDEDFNLVPLGVVGEVFMGGKCLALGYLNNPEQTNARFITSPLDGQLLYQTGDLAKYLPNGMLQYIGRKDGQVKLRGYRVECAEIESLMMLHPQVIKAVVNVKKSSNNEYLVGYITTDASVEDKKAILQQLLVDLKAKLPSYMVPSRMFWIHSFPLSMNGKVDPAKLPSDLNNLTDAVGISAAVDVAEIVPPKDDIEMRLCAYFASLLHIPESQIGTNSNFYELGGTSIHAFNVSSMVKQSFGFKLDLQLFFQNPTVEAVAKLIRASGSNEISKQRMKKFEIPSLQNHELVKLKPATETPSLNLFLIHGAFRNTTVFKSLAKHFPENFNVFAFQDTNPLDVPEDDPYDMEQLAGRYVEEIIAVQPSGSYHIAGYCFGGVMALEIAASLIEKKKAVCTLALIDTTAPTGYNAKGFSTLDSAAIYALLATEVLPSFNVKKELKVADFQAVPPEQQQELMLSTLAQNNVAAQTVVPFLKRAFQHYTSSLTLLVNYTKRLIAGEIMLFSATEEWAFVDYYNPLRREDLGWKDLHPQTCVIPSPGNHLTMIKNDDTCQFLAQQLTRLIEDREGGSSLSLHSGRETMLLSSNMLALSLTTEKVLDDVGVKSDLNSALGRLKRAVFFSLHSPSSFNNQPWHFIVNQQTRSVLICRDWSRFPNTLAAQMSAVDIGCSLYVLESLFELYGLGGNVTYIQRNSPLSEQARKDIQRVPMKAKSLEPLAYLDLNTENSSQKRLRASALLVGDTASTTSGNFAMPTAQPLPPKIPAPKKAIGKQQIGPKGPTGPKMSAAPPKAIAKAVPKTGLPKHVVAPANGGNSTAVPQSAVKVPAAQEPKVNQLAQPPKGQMKSPQLVRTQTPKQPLVVAAPVVPPMTMPQAELNEIEDLIQYRSTNRHDYSTRKPIAFKILKQLSTDPFISQQHNVKTLWINDRARIQRIAMWAELVDRAIFSSRRLSAMISSTIAVNESDSKRLIPMRALELSDMQLASFMSLSQSALAEGNIELVKLNVTMSRGTSKKILNSAGLAVICYQGGAPSTQTLMKMGQVMMATLLKLSKHDISTSVWSNCGALDMLIRRLDGGVTDPNLIALRDQIAETLVNIKNMLAEARIVLPELSDNEGVMSIIRFGYALQESTQKATRLPSSKSVTLL